MTLFPAGFGFFRVSPGRAGVVEDKVMARGTPANCNAGEPASILSIVPGAQGDRNCDPCFGVVQLQVRERLDFARPGSSSVSQMREESGTGLWARTHRNTSLVASWPPVT